MTEVFFPDKSRQFPGKRWVKIGLRTAHLLGLAGTGAIFLLNQGIPGAQFYFYLVIASGIAMMTLDIWSNGIWIYQLRGQAIMVKLCLFIAMINLPEYSSPIFVLIVIISGVVSHASGDVRYYSIIHGRRLDSFEEKG